MNNAPIQSKSMTQQNFRKNEQLLKTKEAKHRNLKIPVIPVLEEIQEISEYSDDDLDYCIGHKSDNYKSHTPQSNRGNFLTA